MSEPKFNGKPINRDPTRFHPTRHFGERVKYRTDPDPSWDIAAETIREGRVLPTQQADRLIFEHDRGWHVWRVLVAVNRAAFDDPDATHAVLTVYAKGVHDANHREVFDEVGGE